MTMATAADQQRRRVSVEAHGALARVVLRNRPLNVIDIPMMDELAAALAAIEAGSEITVIEFRGEGKAFSAGVDIAAHAPDKVGQMLDKFHALIRSLVSTAKITLAAVQGPCLGGGAELAMMCDLVYTRDDATWGFPEIRLGCYPPVACTALAALVGQKKAAELIFTGRSITGTEASQIGLATRALDEKQFEASVEASTSELLQLSPSALRLAKKACSAWERTHFDEGLARAEQIYREGLSETEDAREGIRAFLAKRPPRWTGK